MLHRRPHAEGGVRRLRVVVFESAHELREHRLCVAQICPIDVVALEGVYERLGQAIALRAI